MKSPRVSVVVASRNYGQYIREALDSVRNQTFRDFELIVIDDGSTDDTESIVRPYLSDPRFRYIRCDRLGQSRAKNLGYGLTSGEFVAYLDADDVWLPEKLDRQVRLIDANPKVGLVYSRRRMIAPDGRMIVTPPIKLHRGQLLDRLLVQNSICFSTILIRRSVLEHVGAFDTSLELGIDYELWLRVGMHYEFDYVDDVLVKYRTGHGNLSTRLSDRMVSCISVIRRFLDRRGGIAHLQQKQVSETWASTFRSMGYLHRTTDLRTALGWYTKAIAFDGRLVSSLRSMLACVGSWGRRRLHSFGGGGVGPMLSPENRLENV